MDGGKSSWAKSKDSVLDTVQGAGDLAASLNPDFAMIEEIDLDSTRSYHVNEYDILRNCFPNDYYVFAQNYDSAFLFYLTNNSSLYFGSVHIWLSTISSSLSMW